MTNELPTVLVVDDEELNLEIIHVYLGEQKFRLVDAFDGFQALEIIADLGQQIKAILLDRMMPGMDGLEVLSRLKKNPATRQIPVIMQTASASSKDIEEGLNAGAYYYLTKPFTRPQLLHVIEKALRDFSQYQTLSRQLNGRLKVNLSDSRGNFQIRTLDEAQTLAAGLADLCPDPGKAIVGIAELLQNAIEHGNLDIGYQEKSNLNSRDNLEQEISRRLQLSEHRDKYVEVHYERTHDQIRLLIKDQGSGFDWTDYMNVSVERAFDNHGRGIALARAVSFDRIDFHGCGNTVSAMISLQSPPQSEESALPENTASKDSGRAGIREIV